MTISLLAVAAAYLYASQREKTFVNVFTPMFAIMIPTEYLLEIYHVLEFGPQHSPYAFALSYATYTAYTVGLVFAYTAIRMPSLQLPFDEYSAGRGRLPAYLLLAGAIALYLPVLIKFHSQITDPRAIYQETRVGYGVYFFLSLTLAYLALIMLLFAKNARKFEVALFILVCVTFVWLQGSKGHILGFVFILAMHSVYVKGRRISFPKFLAFVFALSIFGGVLFLITTPSLILDQGINGLAGYSDYTRNGMKVIDSRMGPFYGKLTLQNQIYTRIPRAIDPEKPRDFGDFYLAKHFFPDIYVLHAGAPAFGNGAWFADFGIVAIPLQFLAGILIGLMLKIFKQSTIRYRSPGNFVMLLFASGVPLIALGQAFLLPESLAIAIFANALFAIRVRHSKTLNSPTQALLSRDSPTQIAQS